MRMAELMLATVPCTILFTLSCEVIFDSSASLDLVNGHELITLWARVAFH